MAEQREDQAHRARPVRFTFTTASGPPYLHPVPKTDTFLIDVRRFRGAQETWVYLGSETDMNSSCELTLESARRLNKQLTMTLKTIYEPFYNTNFFGFET